MSTNNYPRPRKARHDYPSFNVKLASGEVVEALEGDRFKLHGDSLLIYSPTEGIRAIFAAGIWRELREVDESPLRTSVAQRVASVKIRPE